MDVLIAAAIGSTALTQSEMNEAAASKGQAAQDKLSTILHGLDPDGSDEELKKAQTAWEVYRDAHASYRSGINDPLPGSIAPLLWWSSYETTTNARIEELEWMIDAEEGMM
jgi:uncharacterized protein YecT (DUF1311 family)